MAAQAAAAPKERAPGLRVIEPKLVPPRVSPGMLRRERLLRLLDGDGGAAVTLLSAPVGYGKTTLLRSWCTERPEPVIWVTLDAGDEDAVRLWTHLATAVERLSHGLGERALAGLSVRGASLDEAIDDLMNGLLALDRPVTMVLDDLHEVRSSASLGTIEYALERLPVNVRLLAATRSDPAIGLAGRRARHTLREVRVRELAFTAGEVRELMSREGVDLSDGSIETLTERTEGWPAGCYLAALWLKGLEDRDAGMREFAGSTRHVADYLGGEVLDALPLETKEFLVRTSVLGRFTPELCDAVLDRDDSGRFLRELERSNMFLVALDGKGRWYRYHHLFGELLQLEVTQDEMVALRRRAAECCQDAGLVEDAIEHYFAAGDPHGVADLLAEHDRELVWGGRTGQFLLWVRRLPAGVLARHPSLAAGAAVAAMLLARPELEVTRLLAVAERAREEQPEQWSPYVKALVEVTRAALLADGDVGAAVAHARRAVEAARSGAEDVSVGALSSLAQALFFAGDPAGARGAALAAVERAEAAAVPDGYVVSLGIIALVDAELGHTERAQAGAEEAIAYAQSHFHGRLWTASMAHLALALALVATGSLDDAEREAQLGERLRRTPRPGVGDAHALLVLAKVRLARSRVGQARKDVAHAQRMIAEFADPGRLPELACAVEEQISSVRGHASERPLVEDPTPAELAVLRGMTAGLSRRETGAQLYISLNTVKTHTRELYRKLGATSRAEAIARAEALGVLDGAESPG